MHSITARLLRPALLTLLACVLTLSALPAQAASPSRAVLEGTIQHCLSMLADPAFANPATRESQRGKIAVEVRKVFDFEEFSARTVGQRWRTFSAAQKQAFSDAFADLLLATYLGQLQNYNGEQIRYTGERSNDKGTRVEQLTEIATRDGKTIPVAYRMLPKNGTWVVYDVIVEGVSLVKNYRTQFQDILTSASPDELTSRIRAKVEEVRSRSKS
ncbi:MAG: ABC transporter substrate-binding protein [Desulfovibrionaceae bacterium]|nr:ABC transporter substrate-binding protein [Desulfovibrionaceae bacterium]